MSPSDEVRVWGYGPAELRDLQREWNERLAREGFPDLENTRGQMKKQKVPPVSLLKQSSALEYYSIARELLWDGTVQGEEGRMLWELHCEGLGIRKISRLVGKTTRFVFDRIKPYRKVMKSRVG